MSESPMHPWEIRYEIVDGHVAVITLDRPDVLNALSHAMFNDIAEALAAAMKDKQVRVAVLTGAGRGFCGGIDTRTVGDPFDRPLVEQQYYLTETVHKLVRAVWSFEKPLIAAINGPAAGFGMDLASWSDIRIASDDATFTMSYVRLGFIPGGGGCHVLPRLVGAQRALDLIWSGRSMKAQEALDSGYVLAVHAKADLLEKALSYARNLASGPPIAQQVAKRLVYDGLESNSRSIGLHQAEYGRILVRSSEDAAEGGRAAAERRRPRFQGR